LRAIQIRLFVQQSARVKFSPRSVFLFIPFVCVKSLPLNFFFLSLLRFVPFRNTPTISFFSASLPSPKLPRRHNSPFSRAIRTAQHEERRENEKLDKQQKARAAEDRPEENQDRSKRIRDAISEAHKHLADIQAQRGIQLLPHRQVKQIARPEEDENYKKKINNAIIEAHKHLAILQEEAEEQFILQIDPDPSDLLGDQELQSN
jgi:hypothetical protein